MRKVENIYWVCEECKKKSDIFVEIIMPIHIVVAREFTIPETSYDSIKKKKICLKCFAEKLKEEKFKDEKY